MTLNQIQQYIVGVLHGWITNKSVLDKFSETTDGKLLYNGIEIGNVTDKEVAQKIADTLAALKKDTTAPMVLSVNINEATGTVKIDGLMFTCNPGTEVTDIVITMDEPIFLAHGAEAVVTQVVKDSTGSVLTSMGVNYGTFTISDSSITITPNIENAITQLPGVIDFTIPAGVIIDQLGNSKAYVFSLTVVDPFADTYQALKANDMIIAPMNSDKYDKYEIAVADELDPSKTNVVSITIENMQLTTNPSGEEGVWAGFFIPGPTNANGYKSKFSIDDVNVLDIIQGNPKPMDEINGILGYGCYGNWLTAKVRYVILQFYEDAECTKPITNIYKFKLVLSENSVFIEE